LAERQPSKLHVASSNLVSRSNPSVPNRDSIHRTAVSLRAAIATVVRLDPTLVDAAERLSAGYRTGSGTGSPGRHVDDRFAAAYAATRMPATFAAASEAMLEGARSLPNLAPRSLLDLGAGTGASAWAASGIWPTLASMTLIEQEQSMVALGRRLAAAAHQGAGPLSHATWIASPVGSMPLEAADVVVVGYVLGELAAREREDLLARAWAATRGALVLIEPGSPAGYERILDARDALISVGATVAAPCPGNVPCPVRSPSWCHFRARLERSPLHRRAKSATLGHEDEPYSYVVLARADASSVVPDPAPRVVLGRPRHGPGRIELRICRDGIIDTRTVSRREGPAYRAARDVAWGERVPPSVAAAEPRDSQKA
jgi:ribosomal protein RSM22 (predicted rRNA methylase)